MKKSIVFTIFLTLTLLASVPVSPLKAESLPLTVAETSNYTKTSLYGDVMEYIFRMQKQSRHIEILTLGTTTEGKSIPLVVVSKEGISSPAEAGIVNKPVIFINANIHAGEIEGKEAMLILLREIAAGKLKDLLENQVILIVPIFNADGNDKLGNNRRDNGPELAGTRYNGQKLDLNRDFLKLESPENRALVKAFIEWDPLLFVDMHTTNGSYHQEPVTYTAHVNPNSAPPLQDYLWDKLFPNMQETLRKEFGYESVPYGNFVNRAEPEKGWINGAFEARYSNNYAGLRDMFAILNENYSHADFKTRVLSSLGFIKAILKYTAVHGKEMKSIQNNVKLTTRNRYQEKKFALDYKTGKLFDLTLKSYEFEKEKIKPEDRDKYPPWYGEYLVKKTDRLKDYRLTYLNKGIPTKEIDLPQAYVILPNHPEVIANLVNHGIMVKRFREDAGLTLEKFELTGVKPASRIYQGRIFITLEGEYKEFKTTIPKGSYYISMKQPLARLIPVLLEPESKDSLASWGFFNRELVTQWTGRPGDYPVFRLQNTSKIPALYQE